MKNKILKHFLKECFAVNLKLQLTLNVGSNNTGNGSTIKRSSEIKRIFIIYLTFINEIVLVKSHI